MYDRFFVCIQLTCKDNLVQYFWHVLQVINEKTKKHANMQSLIQFRKKLCRNWPNIAHEYGQRGEKEQNHIFGVDVIRSL